jgi:TPR repeat protein
MNRAIASALLAVTLTLGCIRVAQAQALKPKPAQAKAAISFAVDAAYARKDYATVVRLLRPLAAQGNAYAQTNLGLMYNNGHGVAQDYVRAHTWFNLAASWFSGEDQKRHRLIVTRLPPR